jgi:hypothetical protein
VVSGGEVAFARWITTTAAGRDILNNEYRQIELKNWIAFPERT